MSGFTSMFSQLLKLFPRTEFRALPEKLADWSFCVSAADRGAERTSRASTTARNLMNRLEVIERAAASLEWHRAVAPVWEVGEITTYGLALSRPRRGFESRWGHHLIFVDGVAHVFAKRLCRARDWIDSTGMP